MAVRVVVRGAARLDVGRPGQPGYRGSPRPSVHGRSGDRRRQVVGYVQCQRTASRLATTDPDRSYTRIVFVDAVEPKKDLSKAATAAQPFPNTIDVSYTLTPAFINSVAPAAARSRSSNARRAAAGHDGAGTSPEDRRRRIRALAVSAHSTSTRKRRFGSAIYGSSSKSRFATRTTPTSPACWRTRRIRS